MATETEDERERRQEWKHIGAGFVLVAVGMIGLAIGLRLSSHEQAGDTADLRSEVVQNRTRIDQLESELRANDLPIPPAITVPSTTTPSRHRTPTTRPARPRPTTVRPSPPTTTAPRPVPPPTTTTTTQPPRRTCVGGLICIGGTP